MMRQSLLFYVLITGHHPVQQTCLAINDWCDVFCSIAATHKLASPGNAAHAWL